MLNLKIAILRDKRAFFFIILFMAICLRLFNLDRGYNSDEGWLLRAASLDLNELMPFLSSGRSVFPPFSPFLLHFWAKINNTEPWIRGYFVIFGVALSILIYLLGRSYLDEHFGLITFFISAISPLLIWSSQFVRSYIDSAFWVVLSVYFMLRLIRGKSFWKNSIGYIFACTTSLYTSYLNILVLLPQSIFIFIVYFKDWRFLKRWLVLEIIIVILFIPSLPLLLDQMRLTTNISNIWSQRGFQLLGLNIGYYTRGVAATFGVDSDFLSIQALTKEFNKIMLIGSIVISFCIVLWFFFIALKKLKIISKDKQLTWFFPGILSLALALFFFLVEIIGFPAQARYFVTYHVLFIFVLSSAIYPIKIKNKGNILVLSLVSLVFILLLPEANKPVFDTKKAANYLRSKGTTNSCLLMVRDTNQYIESKAFNSVILFDSLQKDSDADYYLTLSDQAKLLLYRVKNKYDDILFYRLYGNDEVLGANRLIMEWLCNNGYTIKNIKKLRRIDIINYKRMD